MAEKVSPESVSYEIDEVGVFEIDKSVFNWLTIKRPLTINNRKVPVIFGAWERFAQMQSNKDDENLNSLRDKNGMIKLPVISIRRNEISVVDNRFMEFMEGENHPRITYYKKIAAAKFDNKRVPFVPKWKVGNEYKTSEPVYELYSLPFPVFITVPYTITFWASYIRHANLFQDLMWFDTMPHDIQYKGYYFHSYIEGESNESNVDDFSSEERIIKLSINLNVEAYIIDKKEVTISRTLSNIIMEEKLIDGDDVEENLGITLYT